MQKLFKEPDFFSLRFSHRQHHTRLTLQILGAHVNTRTLPFTYTMLSLHLPSVMQAQCFNDAHLPFSKEVKATEIGHLFEHILLEYLCLLKIGSGCKYSTYSGNTSWNWLRDPQGVFHITVDAGKNDMALFQKALQRTIILMKTILMSAPLPAFSNENTIEKNSWGQPRYN